MSLHASFEDRRAFLAVFAQDQADMSQRRFSENGKKTKVQRNFRVKVPIVVNDLGIWASQSKETSYD